MCNGIGGGPGFLISGFNKLVFKVLSVSTEVHKFWNVFSISQGNMNSLGPSSHPLLQGKHTWAQPQAGISKELVKAISLSGLAGAACAEKQVSHANIHTPKRNPCWSCSWTPYLPKEDQGRNLHSQWSWFKDHPSNSQQSSSTKLLVEMSRGPLPTRGGEVIRHVSSVTKRDIFNNWGRWEKNILKIPCHLPFTSTEVQRLKFRTKSELKHFI